MNGFSPFHFSNAFDQCVCGQKVKSIFVWARGWPKIKDHRCMPWKNIEDFHLIFDKTEKTSSTKKTFEFFIVRKSMQVEILNGVGEFWNFFCIITLATQAIASKWKNEWTINGHQTRPGWSEPSQLRRRGLSGPVWPRPFWKRSPSSGLGFWCSLLDRAATCSCRADIPTYDLGKSYSKLISIWE